MDDECVVSHECIYELIDFFATRGTQYKARLTDKKYEVVEKMCLHLLARDYYIQTIDNSDGSLCPHYPSHMIILERESSERDKRKTVNDTKQISELFVAGRSARCFCRFPVPVILFKRKNICRSSTLSTAAELYGRSGLEWMFSGGNPRTTEINDTELPWQHERKPSEWSLVDQAREYDSQLISILGVGLICDLMVEMRKTAYGMTVTSSEKADGSQWYSRFTLASIPYPGCEFFYNYRSHSKHSEELHYDWSKSFNDATLSIPSPLPESVGVSYNNYQTWNIVQLTQNYLKLILHYLNHEDNGVLVHCISGWDRTPLYISIIRLSLWADGLIHTSLKPTEILYLTLAYDWFMFGHKFEERLKKSEEVLYFCFDFLKHISSDEYSIASQLPTDTVKTDTDSPVTTTSTDATNDGIVTSSSSDRTVTTTTSDGIVITTSASNDSTVVTTVNTTSASIDETGLSLNDHTRHIPSLELQMESTDSLHNTDDNKSLGKVYIDTYHGSCLYNPSLIHNKSPSPDPMEDITNAYQGSARRQRLLNVRDLFITAYKKALPPVDEGYGSRLVSVLLGKRNT